MKVLDDGADQGSLESFPQKPKNTAIEVLDDGADQGSFGSFPQRVLEHGN